MRYMLEVYFNGAQEKVAELPDAERRAISASTSRSSARNARGHGRQRVGAGGDGDEPRASRADNRDNESYCSWTGRSARRRRPGRGRGHRLCYRPRRAGSGGMHGRVRIEVGPSLSDDPLHGMTRMDGSSDLPGCGPGDWHRAAPPLGGHAGGQQLSARPARHHAVSPNPGFQRRGHAELFRVSSASQKAPICTHFSCRRRDSNPRHADIIPRHFGSRTPFAAAGRHKRGHIRRVHHPTVALMHGNQRSRRRESSPGTWCKRGAPRRR